jgi:hypothetical protein
MFENVMEIFTSLAAVETALKYSTLKSWKSFNYVIDGCYIATFHRILFTMMKCLQIKSDTREQEANIRSRDVNFSSVNVA